MSDNIVKFQDEDKWRWYEIDGERYPSVTTIIGETVVNKKLQDWYKKTSGNAIQKRLAFTSDFGTEAHRIFEAIVLGRETNIGEDHTKHADAFRVWAKDNQVTATATEKVVYSKTLGFAGTLDFLGTVKGQEVIMDFKTSTRYAITNGWQMGAYLLAAQEMGLASPETGLTGLSVNRETAEIKAFKYQHIDFVCNAFLSTLNVFKALHFHKLNKLNWPWLLKG